MCKTGLSARPEATCELLRSRDKFFPQRLKAPFEVLRRWELRFCRLTTIHGSLGAALVPYYQAGAFREGAPSSFNQPRWVSLVFNLS